MIVFSFSLLGLPQKLPSILLKNFILVALVLQFVLDGSRSSYDCRSGP